MGLLTWVAVGAIVLVVIGLGAGVFFTGLLEGAERVAENPAVQNATDEAREFVDDRVNTGISSVIDESQLVINTDRSTYELREPVVITLTNAGEETLSFPNSALGIAVKNIDTGKTYNVVSAQVVTELDPGESKVITWNQQDAGGDRSVTGNYVVSAKTVPNGSALAAESSFRIE